MDLLSQEETETLNVVETATVRQKQKRGDAEVHHHAFTDKTAKMVARS
jgi:hypothetical protein